LEALYRLAEASARVRLSDTVTLTDAERAVSIFTEYLRRVGMDPETGNFDIDLIATGISHSQHELMRSIQDIIKTICNDSEDNNASRSDIISEAEVKGLESKRVESALDRLKRNGEIFEPVRGKYRIT
jgi:replicative DNA helicase Mcm